MLLHNVMKFSFDAYAAALLAAEMACPSKYFSCLHLMNVQLIFLCTRIHNKSDKFATKL